MWRWDQGRLEYFQFENLRLMARALHSLEGVDLRLTPDPLRVPMTQAVGLTFKPLDYRVWRNYGRILKSALLALEVDNRLVLTDIGRWLATDEAVAADDYLAIVTQRFRYPSPAFQQFAPSAQLIFPFAAILNWLFGRRLAGLPARLTVEAAIQYLIGNGCTGLESPEQLAQLPPTSCKLSADATRQLRELLLLISQFSFLSWHDGVLALDFTATELTPAVLSLTVPDVRPVQAVAEADLLSLATLSVAERIGLLLPEPADTADEVEEPLTTQVPSVYAEGQRVYRTHRRIERNRLLRQAFFLLKPQAVCEMCTLDTRIRYPWTVNLLEIHHLLPLAATPAITRTGTSLTDLVALCPSCHRSIHVYYRTWLTANQRRDFADKTEAGAVYAAAKAQIIL